MKITTNAIIDGYFRPEFGKYATNKRADGRVIFSPDIEIHEEPEDTVSYALFMEDRDAIPVCGFSWIHWVACNITQTHLEAGASEAAFKLFEQGAEAPFVQGANSWISPLAGSMDRIAASVYGGMAPPDRDHQYEIYVFALDTLLDLKQGFYANELFHAMEGHILWVDSIKGIYKA